MANIDQQRILADYYLTKKGVSRVLARKPLPENPLQVFKVLDLDRSENYHDFCGQEYEDWKNFKPNSWGY